MRSLSPFLPKNGPSDAPRYASQPPKEWLSDAPRYAQFSQRMALRRASLCTFPQRMALRRASLCPSLLRYTGGIPPGYTPPMYTGRHTTRVYTSVTHREAYHPGIPTVIHREAYHPGIHSCYIHQGGIPPGYTPLLYTMGGILPGYTPLLYTLGIPPWVACLPMYIPGYTSLGSMPPYVHPWVYTPLCAKSLSGPLGERRELCAKSLSGP